MKLTTFIIFLLSHLLALTAFSNEAPEDSNTHGTDGDNASITIPTTSSNALLADPDFDFNTSRTIRLNIGRLPSDYGKINVYHAYEYYDEDYDTYYPAYDTLLASFVASTTVTYSVNITEEVEYLIIEWLPMDGLSNEAYQRLPLNDEQHYMMDL